MFGILGVLSVKRFGFEFTVVVALLRVLGCFELFVVLMGCRCGLFSVFCVTLLT